MIWLLIMIMLIAFSAAIFLFERNIWQQQVRIKVPHISRQYSIVYARGIFSPTNLLIHVNDSVVIKNNSDMLLEIEEFQSGGIDVGKEFTYTFLLEGVYSYNNSHNKNEGGTITVQK